MNKFFFIWEIPLALLSFLFYKIMKFAIGNIFTVYLALNKEKASQWRLLSAETLQSPLSLPVLMTKGPRWNTHAIIGTLGPFSVKKSIALDLKSANNSSKSWIAVIYSFPSYKTITSLKYNENKLEEKWESLSLEPGKYTIGLRYYNWCEEIYLPSIQVDGEKFVDSQFVPHNINNFYHDLIKEKNGFYSSLHYYIFTILKLRKQLPESFVKSEFLPVGAPDTTFFFDYLEKGKTLTVEVKPSILDNYELYFTTYDRSSLPISWCQIKSAKFTENIKYNGFYLIRVRQKDSLSTENLRDAINILMS